MRYGFYLGGMTGPGSGSWTRLMGRITSLLTQEGVEIVVYSPRKYLGDFPEAPGLRVHEVPQRGFLGRVFLSGTDVRRAARRDRLDVLEFQTTPLPRRTGVPTLLSINDTRNFYGISSGIRPAAIAERIRRDLRRSASRRARSVVTLTQWSGDDVVSKLGIGPSKVVVVPHSIDAGQVPEISEDTVFSFTGDFVAAVGHLEERKNLQVIAQAVLEPSWPNRVRLLLAGADHGERARLEAIAERSGGLIQLLGPVSESEKWRLLSGARLVLVPSLLEGFGIVVCEAISAGTPVLVSDRTALPEVVGVDRAVLPADDPSVWAREVGRLITDDPARRQLFADQQRQLVRFGHETVGRKFLSDLQSVLEDTPAMEQVDIVHLAYGGIGGHRAVVEGLAHALSLRGVRSSAILIGSPNSLSESPDWQHLVSSERVTIGRRGDAASMIAVARSVYRLKPSVVVAHTHRHIVAAYLGMLARRSRSRVVMVEHQPLPLRSKINDFWSLVGILVSSGLVVLSAGYLNDYRWRAFAKFLGRPTAVIPNGVSLPDMTIMPQRENGRFTFGMACRLIPSKDLVSLIRSLQHLSPDHGLWHCRIAGQGPQRDFLQLMVESLGLAGSVTFDGALSAHEMESWYGGLDVYVQATFGEAMSMSLLEAAAHGLPIVTSDVPGISEVFVDGESAVILPSTTPEAIADALTTLRLSGSGHTMGARAREIVEARHSTEAMGAAYQAFFAEVGGLKVTPPC